MALVGTKINALPIPGLHRRAQRAQSREGVHGWARWAHAVADRPWPALIAGLAILVALMIPVVLAAPRPGRRRHRAKGSEQRVAFDLLSEGFGPGEQRAAARRRARRPAGGRPDPAGDRAGRGRRRGGRVAADPVPGRPGRPADRDADNGARRPRDRGARAAAAQRRHRADRHRRAGRRPDRGRRRPRGGDLRPPAARHRLRARAELPAAPARVPVDRAADQGGGDEPPVDRRGLRRGDARLPGGLRHLAHRAVGPGADRVASSR